MRESRGASRGGGIMDERKGMGALLPMLVGFLALAAPLVLVVWHELSELLLGRVHARPLALATLLLAALAALARQLARRLLRTSDADDAR